MKEINERVSKLRKEMLKAGVSACIIPGTDPHASEYIADCWKEREWISGFNGSAGTALIALEKAGLWTDSRYFLQGSEQLDGTCIDLMKQGTPETLDIIPWLASELKEGEKVAVNPQMFSVNAFAAMKAELAMSNIELVSVDLMAEVWTDRPALPTKPFFVFDTKFTGKSTTEKLKSVRQELKKSHAHAFILSALDDIAWLFNIRGNDVDYNPVTIAYALVEEEKATLFIENEKLTAETNKYLQNENVSIAPYLSVYDALKSLPSSKAILIDGAKLNQSLLEAIPETCAKRNTMSPVFKLKSIKNEVEIAGFKRAMQKDGVALTRFFKWLEENVNSGEQTELTITEKLYQSRREQSNFMGQSFGTICGFAGHGAIVHYSANEKSDVKIKPNNMLLLDSGGQYLDGTTDITRTVSLGNTSKAQITDFTNVLKGHISLSSAIFPTGTRGSQLDILARKALWDECLNYGHGTGHGIGHFLNVHEGPQSIRMDENPITLEVGMILSNEPGMYRTNEYGIRIENLVQVVAAQKTEFGQFLKFDTLTVFPIDKNLIDKTMLTDKEIIWLNDYHKKVYDTISPLLSQDEKEWLKNKCAAL
jgi:Xaa-Pro aminopeptidase